jgi:hypothetical protein
MRAPRVERATSENIGAARDESIPPTVGSTCRLPLHGQTTAACVVLRCDSGRSPNDHSSDTYRSRIVHIGPLGCAT